MKLFKKILSVVAVLALVITAVPAKAKAATDAIDFEDGNVPSTIFMKANDGGDMSKLSIKDFNGSKALFVEIQDATLVPKVQMDVMALVGASNLDKVRAITFDLAVESPTGDILSWNGGSGGANITADGSVWYAGADWTIQDDKNSVSEVTKYLFKFVDGMGYTKDATASSYLFMKWAGANNMYIDNIQFLDADGNALAIQGAADAAVTDTTAAATDTTAAADVPKTGETSFALFFLAGAALMAIGAVVVKNRKTVQE